MRFRSGRRVPLLAALGVICSCATAFAIEQGSASADLALSAATVAPPTGLTAVANCPNTKKGDVLVQWSASASAFVTGYTVLRSVSGGTAATVATLPAATTSYDDTTVAGLTTYGYTVLATYRNWSSAPVVASATTAKHC